MTGNIDFSGVIGRRELGLLSALAVAAGAVGTAITGVSSAEAKQAKSDTSPARTSGVTDAIVTKDGVTIYFKDWGPKKGPIVTLSHGWPLSSDSWENLAFFLAERGFRVVAHDRRGHGRSSQAWEGNDMDHYADDLASVIDTLRLDRVSMFGFSTGGGEVARYVGRHGTSKIARLGLISAVPPIMVKTDFNPNGLPISVFDDIRKGMIADRSKIFKDIPSGPFYGFNRPGKTVNQAMVDYWWLQGMQGGFKNTYDSVKAFSETDFREDLKKFNRPTLIIHGADDQIVPIDRAGRASKEIVTHALLKVYDGAPHGLIETHKDQFHKDMLEFLSTSI